MTLFSKNIWGDNLLIQLINCYYPQIQRPQATQWQNNKQICYPNKNRTMTLKICMMETHNCVAGI